MSKKSLLSNRREGSGQTSPTESNLSSVSPTLSRARLDRKGGSASVASPHNKRATSTVVILANEDMGTRGLDSFSAPQSPSKRPLSGRSSSRGSMVISRTPSATFLPQNADSADTSSSFVIDQPSTVLAPYDLASTVIPHSLAKDPAALKRLINERRMRRLALQKGGGYDDPRIEIFRAEMAIAEEEQMSVLRAARDRMGGGGGGGSSRPASPQLSGEGLLTRTLSPNTATSLSSAHPSVVGDISYMRRLVASVQRASTLVEARELDAVLGSLPIVSGGVTRGKAPIISGSGATPSSKSSDASNEVIAMIGNTPLPKPIITSTSTLGFLLKIEEEDTAVSTQRALEITLMSSAQQHQRAELLQRPYRGSLRSGSVISKNASLLANASIGNAALHSSKVLRKPLLPGIDLIERKAAHTNTTDTPMGRAATAIKEAHAQPKLGGRLIALANDNATTDEQQLPLSARSHTSDVTSNATINGEMVHPKPDAAAISRLVTLPDLALMHEIRTVGPSAAAADASSLASITELMAPTPRSRRTSMVAQQQPMNDDLDDRGPTLPKRQQRRSLEMGGGSEASGKNTNSPSDAPLLQPPQTHLRPTAISAPPLDSSHGLGAFGNLEADAVTGFFPSDRLAIPKFITTQPSINSAPIGKPPKAAIPKGPNDSGPGATKPAFVGQPEPHHHITSGSKIPNEAYPLPEDALKVRPASLGTSLPAGIGGSNGGQASTSSGLVGIGGSSGNLLRSEVLGSEVHLTVHKATSELHKGVPSLNPGTLSSSNATSSANSPVVGKRQQQYALARGPDGRLLVDSAKDQTVMAQFQTLQQQMAARAERNRQQLESEAPEGGGHEWSSTSTTNAASKTAAQVAPCSISSNQVIAVNSAYRQLTSRRKAKQLEEMAKNSIAPNTAAAGQQNVAIAAGGVSLVPSGVPIDPFSYLAVYHQHAFLVGSTLATIHKELQTQKAAWQLKVEAQRRKNDVVRPMPFVESKWYYPSDKDSVKEPERQRRLRRLQTAVRQSVFNFSFRMADGSGPDTKQAHKGKSSSTASASIANATGANPNLVPVSDQSFLSTLESDVRWEGSPITVGDGFGGRTTHRGCDGIEGGGSGPSNIKFSNTAGASTANSAFGSSGFSPVIDYVCGRHGGGLFNASYRTFSTIFEHCDYITPRALRDTLTYKTSCGILSPTKVKHVLIAICPPREALMASRARAAQQQRAEVMRKYVALGGTGLAFAPHEEELRRRELGSVRKGDGGSPMAISFMASTTALPLPSTAGRVIVDFKPTRLEIGSDHSPTRTEEALKDATLRSQQLFNECVLLQQPPQSNSSGPLISNAAASQYDPTYHRVPVLAPPLPPAPVTITEAEYDASWALEGYDTDSVFSDGDEDSEDVGGDNDGASPSSHSTHNNRKTNEPLTSEEEEAVAKLQERVIANAIAAQSSSLGSAGAGAGGSHPDATCRRALSALLVSSGGLLTELRLASLPSMSAVGNNPLKAFRGGDALAMSNSKSYLATLPSSVFDSANVARMRVTSRWGKEPQRKHLTAASDATRHLDDGIPLTVASWLDTPFPVAVVKRHLAVLLETVCKTQLIFSIYEFFLPTEVAELRRKHLKNILLGVLPPTDTWVPPPITDSALAACLIELEAALPYPKERIQLVKLFRDIFHRFIDDYVFMADEKVRLAKEKRLQKKEEEVSKSNRFSAVKPTGGKEPAAQNALSRRRRTLLADTNATSPSEVIGGGPQPELSFFTFTSAESNPPRGLPSDWTEVGQQLHSRGGFAPTTEEKSVVAAIRKAKLETGGVAGKTQRAASATNKGHEQSKQAGGGGSVSALRIATYKSSIKQSPTGNELVDTQSVFEGLVKSADSGVANRIEKERRDNEVSQGRSKTVGKQQILTRRSFRSDQSDLLVKDFETDQGAFDDDSDELEQSSLGSGTQKDPTEAPLPAHLVGMNTIEKGSPLYFEIFMAMLQTSGPFTLFMLGVILHVCPPHG